MPSSFVRTAAAAITLVLAPTPHLAAQDSSTVLPVPPPPLSPIPPTPEQTRYLEGLRTVGRGVAQLKDGINRVSRTQQVSDTVRQRQAGRRLAGLCGTARSFIATGRPRMQPTAYEDSMRISARQLVVRIDSVLKALPACETTAGKTPVPVATSLLNKLRAYEAALATFRAGLARVDSIQPPS